MLSIKHKRLFNEHRPDVIINEIDSSSQELTLSCRIDLAHF